MKKMILAFCLLLSSALMAQDQLTPISEGDIAITCGENEEVVEIVVGRYCLFRDPITYSCMAWENLYREICQPKADPK